MQGRCGEGGGAVAGGAQAVRRRRTGGAEAAHLPAERSGATAFKLQLELVSLAERNGAPVATLPAIATGEARAVGGRPALLRRRRRSREHLKEGLGCDVGLAHAAHGGDFLGVGHQNGRGSFDVWAQPRVVRTEDLAALVRITCVGPQILQ